MMGSICLYVCHFVECLNLFENRMVQEAQNQQNEAHHRLACVPIQRSKGQRSRSSCRLMLSQTIGHTQMGITIFLTISLLTDKITKTQIISSKQPIRNLKSINSLLHACEKTTLKTANIQPINQIQTTQCQIKQCSVCPPPFFRTTSQGPRGLGVRGQLTPHVRLDMMPLLHQDCRPGQIGACCLLGLRACAMKRD